MRAREQHERKTASWRDTNIEMLKDEYQKWVSITKMEIPFDTFCQQAAKCMPFTATGG